MERVRALQNGHPIPLQFHSKELELPTIPFLSTSRNENIRPIPTSGMAELHHSIPLIPKREKMATVNHTVAVKGSIKLLTLSNAETAEKVCNSSLKSFILTDRLLKTDTWLACFVR